jgi:NAD(P)H-nitrite reductase large subunit
MQLDDELCLCFHVSKRKVLNFLRVEKPLRASQMSECFGAGTGCGWCRPYLEKLFSAAQQSKSSSLDADVAQVDLPETADYAAGRTEYVKSGHGTPPPGATPIGE